MDSDKPFYWIDMSFCHMDYGEITEYDVTEDRIWSLFNYVFSDSCSKRNTYKFGLIKSLLDKTRVFIVEKSCLTVFMWTTLFHGHL